MVEFGCRDVIVIFSTRVSILYLNAEMKSIQKTHLLFSLVMVVFFTKEMQGEES